MCLVAGAGGYEPANLASNSNVHKATSLVNCGLQATLPLLR